MADLLIFFPLISTWKSVKPQQRLKTMHTLKLNLRIMEEGKGYSKGVGPFRVPTMWVSKLSSQWYAPSNIEDLSFKRQAVLPQGRCTMTFAVSVFFFISPFSQRRNVVPVDRARVTHDILCTIHPPGNNPWFHNRSTWIVSCYHASGLKLLVDEISSFGTLQDIVPYLDSSVFLWQPGFWFTKKPWTCSHESYV